MFRSPEFGASRVDRPTLRPVGRQLLRVICCSAALVAASGTRAASTDPYESIYAELDRRLQAGEGLRAAPLRPDEDPGTRDRVAGSSGEAGWAAAEARRAARLKQQLDELAAEIQDECGSDELGSVVVGMSERRFQGCTVQARFGGLSHVVEYAEDETTARLYVLTNGPKQRIYVVDGVVRALRAPPPAERLAEVERLSSYPPNYLMPLVLTLPDGDVFLYGQSFGEDWGLPEAHLLDQLSDPGQRDNRYVRPPPLQWHARLQGWIRLPPPPECDGHWRLHTLSRMPQGRVLVAAGVCDIARLANDPGPYEPQLETSVWDSVARVWLPGPRLRDARLQHTATELPDGQVLLSGGLGDPLHRSPGEPLASVELLSVDTRTDGMPMRQGRAQHSATLLADGAVLAVGGRGRDGEILATVERRDPHSGAWEFRASMGQPRRGHAATSLRDGRVLVTGGIGARGEALNTTEFYDPLADAWVPGPPLPAHVQGHTVAVLDDGTVVVAGGLVERPRGESSWLTVLPPGADRWERSGVRRDLNSISRVLAHRTQIVPVGSEGAILFLDSEIAFWRRDGQPLATTGRPAAPAFSARWVEPHELETATAEAPATAATATTTARLPTAPIALGLASVAALGFVVTWSRRRRPSPTTLSATGKPRVEPPAQRVRLPESSTGTLLFLKLLAVPVIAALLNQILLFAADSLGWSSASEYTGLTPADQARVRFLLQVQVTLIATLLIGKPLLLRWARRGRDRLRHWLGAWFIVHAPVAALHLGAVSLPLSLRLGMVASLFGSLIVVAVLWWRLFYCERPTDAAG